MSDKKIEIEAPEDYELVQDGMNIKFVKSDKRFLSWEEKDSGLNGYYIDVAVFLGRLLALFSFLSKN
jgi:hypothetical protein